MKKTLADKLLASLPINSSDAARLALECSELLNLSQPSRSDFLASMRQVLRLGSLCLKQRLASVPFRHAVLQHLASKANRRPVTLRDIRYYSNKFINASDWAARPIRSLSSRECRDLLERLFSHSPSSFRKARAILHSIFSFSLRRQWCDANPVSCIEPPPVIEKEIIPLDLPQIRRLESAASLKEHRPMRLPLHLMLYCGIRPTEVQRLDPARDINWKQRTVYIRPQTSKTGGGRLVPLRLHRKLSLQPPSSMSIPKHWRKKWKDLRLAAGFTSWQPDALRHTFATYHAAHFRNLPELQLEMGHRSLSLLRSRYLNPGRVSPKHAKLFWDERRNTRAKRTNEPPDPTAAHTSRPPRNK